VAVRADRIPGDLNPTAALQWFESIPSTQDVVHQLASDGAPAGTAVAAREQTAGRGSLRRNWESPIGGLWLSVLLRPGVASALEVLSLRAALAVTGAIEVAVPGLTLELKWPNDLMLDGRKVGGILCEARWHGPNLGWVAIGLGVNVSNSIPASLATNAIALDSFSPGAEPEPLAAPLATALAKVGDSSGHLSQAELASFRSRDWLRGKRLREPLPGTAMGVGPDGALILQRDDGTTQEIRTGSVLLDG
jgi:BirA family transcriptional regulator, biotin operon repressor / biotin---[acetyl-CoA-carboxylase] ligase